MKSRFAISFLPLYILIFCSIIYSCNSNKNPSKATLVILNAKIWTGNSDADFVEAMAIRGNTIIETGSNEQIKKLAGTETEILDLKGKLVIPGFNDAHIHFTSGASILSNVDLLATTNLAQMKSVLVDYAKGHPEKQWLKGRGWQYGFFPGGMPDKSYLDSLVPDRPVFLSAYDGHTGLANSKALELAGIDQHSTFQGFGSILKDAQGNPTGVFLEGAQSLIRKAIPEDTPEEQFAAAKACMRHLSSLGITSIQNAHGDEEEYKLFSALLDSNAFTLRYAMAFSVDKDTKEDEINTFINLKNKKTDRNWFKAEAIKFMIDGVIESHTAIMLEPYSDIPANHKEQKNDFAMPLKQYQDRVLQLDKAGFQLYTHAIGDRSVREVLNAYEQAIKINQRKDQRFRIEHIEQVDQSDIPRFEKLGVMPSMQPIHADPGTVDVWGKNVGDKRLPNSFVWKSMIDNGATLVYGSDWPACISVDPIRGLHSAVNRQTTEGLPVNGWVPEQKLSVAQALRSYTVNGAFSSFDENTKGKLQKGFLADFVVLSQDLFSIPPQNIHQTKVLLTVVDGKEQFSIKNANHF